jgi:chemotaxis regulatin CheY-phosphate phosphatase CheZ
MARGQRKKKETDWTQEDWDEWYHREIEKMARSLKPKIKVILKKMEWNPEDVDQVLEDLSYKIQNMFYPD